MLKLKPREGLSKCNEEMPRSNRTPFRGKNRSLSKICPRVRKLPETARKALVSEDFRRLEAKERVSGSRSMPKSRPPCRRVKIASECPPKPKVAST